MNAKRCRAFALCAALLVLCTLQAVKADASDGQCSLTIVSRFDANAFAGRTFSLYAVAVPAAVAVPVVAVEPAAAVEQ